MPILEVIQGSAAAVLTVACIKCKTEQTVDTSTLTLGTDAHSTAIALPPCKCGAMEFLQHTFDVHPNDAQAGHRKTVNALAEALKAQGKVHPAHVAKVAKAPKSPQIGPLVGVVPDSSLPASLITKRQRARTAAAVATASQQVPIVPASSDPNDPMAIVLKMFQQAQTAFEVVKARKPSGPTPAVPPAPIVVTPVVLPPAPVLVIVAPAPAPLTPPTGNPTT